VDRPPSLALLRACPAVAHHQDMCAANHDDDRVPL